MYIIVTAPPLRSQLSSRTAYPGTPSEPSRNLLSPSDPAVFAMAKIGKFASQDFCCFCCEVFARIRRLRNYPRHLLVILQWKISVSATLCKTSAKTAQT